MTSHWRGEKRITSAPKREISKREAAVAISSIAQQASPIGIGQSEFLRTQFNAASKRVKITLPSIFESYAVARVSAMRTRYRERIRTQDRSAFARGYSATSNVTLTWR